MTDSDPTQTAVMPLLSFDSLKKPGPKQAPRQGPRRGAGRHEDYLVVPDNSDGEHGETPAKTPQGAETQEVILAAQRKNKMRENDRDGPGDPNAMYWDSK